MKGVFLYDDLVLESLRRVYGDDVDRFLEAISLPGKRLYVRVNTLKVSADELIDRLRARGLKAFPDEELPEAVYFPVEGPNEVEELELRVYVDKYAAESVYIGSNLYAPGVVDCDARIKRGDEVSIVGPGGFVVANGIAEMSCYEMKRRGRGLAVSVFRSVFRAPPLRDLPEFREGLFYPQSLPAMYVARVLDPKPGDVVVDMCAAPGGKTSHIVELSKGRAKVIAFDHSRSRLKQMRENLRRLGLERFVEVKRADSRYISVDYPMLKADKILVDPPCSALGVRPKLYDVKSYRDVVSAAAYQRQFLGEATRIAKPGAVIVYSVCTVTIEECEEVVLDVVKRASRKAVLDFIEVQRFSRGVGLEEVVRVHPHIHDHTGFFIARVRIVE